MTRHSNFYIKNLVSIINAFVIFICFIPLILRAQTPEVPPPVPSTHFFGKYCRAPDGQLYFGGYADPYPSDVKPFYSQLSDRLWLVYKPPATSTVGDCYTCACSDRIYPDNAYPSCIRDQNLKPAIKIGSSPKEMLISPWGKFNDSTCYYKKPCQCGTKPNLSSGECDTITGLVPQYKNRSNIVINGRNFVQYMFSETGDPDESCFVKKQDRATSCPDCKSDGSAANGPNLCVGNPVNCGIAAKTQVEPLINPLGSDRLSIGLQYRSLGSDYQPLTYNELGNMGGWELTNYVRMLVVPNAPIAILYPGHETHVFELNGSEYIPNNKSYGSLQRLPGGWQLTTVDGTVLKFDASGNLYEKDEIGLRKQFYIHSISASGKAHLTQLTDRFGRNIKISYDAQDNILSISDPNQNGYLFSYGLQGALASIRLPDGSSKQYLYENGNFPYALTGIAGDDGQKFANYGYDDIGRAVLTEHQNNADRTEIQYLDANHVQVYFHTSMISGYTKIFSEDVIAGSVRITGVSWKPCDTCNNVSETYSYDANGYLQTKTDAKGISTNYSFDDRGNLLQKIEGIGASGDYNRQVSVRWNVKYNVPEQIDRGQLRESFLYDSDGKLLKASRSDKASSENRNIALSYDNNGMLSAIDGPRDDVNDTTNLSYDSQGNLYQITNALGQSVYFPLHDANGNIQQIIDKNNVATNIMHDTAGRVVSIEKLGRQWQFSYDLLGNIIKDQNPKGGRLDLNYSGLNRLTSLYDQTGGHIEYELDLMGNRLSTKAIDADGNILRALYASYDDHGHRVGQDYDDNGNLTKSTDYFGNISTAEYDPLNEIEKFTNGENATTSLERDKDSKLVTKITDAKNFSRAYTYNAFGNLVRQQIPESGITTFSYDKNGNLILRQDARGVIEHRTYDALNRLTSIYFTGNTISGTVGVGPVNIKNGLDGTLVYSYDGLNNGQPDYSIGHLTGITGNQNDIAFRYDAFGNLINDTRKLGSETKQTVYSYDELNKVASIQYPSGRIVRYQRDNFGKITKIDTQADGGASTEIMNDVTYESIPGGKLIGYSNRYSGQSGSDSAIPTDTRLLPFYIKRTYDSFGRLIGQTKSTEDILFSGLERTYSYERGNNVSELDDNSVAVTLKNANGPINVNLYDTTSKSVIRDPRKYTYHYDLANRLIEAEGVWGKINYEYDLVGNRTHQTFQPAHPAISDTNYSNPTGPANLPKTKVTNYDYNPATGQLADIVLNDGANTTTTTYGYTATGQLSALGDTIISYDNSDRPYLTTKKLPDQIASLVNHFSPENWRDEKLSQKNLTRFSYDSSGHLLEESNIAVSTAMQTADPFITQGLGIINKNLGTAISTASGLANSALSTANLGATPFDTNSVQPINDGLQADLRCKLYPARREIIWMDDMPVATIQRRTAGGTNEIFYIHNDQLNQPQRMTDTNGFVAWERSQLPFGEDWQDPQPALELSADSVINQTSYVGGKAISTITGMSFPLRFPGQFEDFETGFFQNRFRDYDPNLGRYVQADPLGVLGGFNPYQYANQNPIGYIDAYGLFCLTNPEIGAIAGSIGGAIAGSATLDPAVVAIGALTGAVYGAISGSVSDGDDPIVNQVTSAEQGALSSMGPGGGNFAAGGAAGTAAALNGYITPDDASRLGGDTIAALTGALGGVIASAATEASAGPIAALAAGNLAAREISNFLKRNNDCDGCNPKNHLEF